MSRPLVLATRNHKKKQEIREILGDLAIELHDLSQYPHAPEVVEDGDTFEVNARKKASETAQALRQWVLGEDSGLVVPALGGQPGVLSARYAGKQGDDAANNAKLLAELAKLTTPSPPSQGGAKGGEVAATSGVYEAYYVCTAALADPTGAVHAVVEGRCHGVMLREFHGQGGFGYDPLFLIPEWHQTFGELSSRVKHALSHRARALEQLRPVLQRLLK